MQVLQEDFSKKYFYASRSRQLQTASNRLLLSLIVADLIVLVNCYQIIVQHFMGGPSFGQTGNVDQN